MSINYAILGMLSAKPRTGYDLKKIMQDSPFMYWSGNNNQIYKALVSLLDEGLVTNEVHHQDSAPSKKIYTITDAGLRALKEWSLSRPEAPELKKPFLVQLAWSWQLSDDELATLLEQYEQDIRGQLFIAQHKAEDTALFPDRTAREAAIWALIHENITEAYRQELHWIDKVRQAAAATANTQTSPGQAPAEERNIMQYDVMEKYGRQYIQLSPAAGQIQTEQDGLDLIALCAQHGTNLLLIPGEAFSEDFYRLRTGIAGAILQKFAQYSIRAAIILDKTQAKGAFKDFLNETNRGTALRTYADEAEAERWLLGAG